MLEKIKAETIDVATKVLQTSSYPFFDKFGENSFQIFAGDQEGVFNPLLVFSVREDKSNYVVSIFLKKDTSDLTQDKPYKKGQFDCVEEIVYSHSGYHYNLEKTIKKIAPFCFL